MSSIVYNHDDSPIHITYHFKAKLGGQGTMEARITLRPGDGIDLETLGLKPGKPGEWYGPTDEEIVKAMDGGEK